MFARGYQFSLSRAAAGPLIAALLFATGTAAAASENQPASEKKKPKLVDLWHPGDPGERMNIRGRVTSLDGTPLAGIKVEIRQPDGDGLWTEQYSTTLITDSRGRYQFGSVVPVANYCGDPHVEVIVYQNGWEYFDDKLVVQDHLDAEGYYFGDGTQVFLEESSVKGETVKFGRYDIVLSPE
ncbi:MAG TPA: hypothetical protein VKB27_22250 [Gammaproteobacteria bacterium]|nr:hypothetical protein [Gammaproteobacteria bacterium]